jgi:hypothetical protein
MQFTTIFMDGDKTTRWGGVAMASKATREQLLDLLRDMLLAEARYQNAFFIYREHPRHKAGFLKAEREWQEIKGAAKVVLDAEGSVSNLTIAVISPDSTPQPPGSYLRPRRCVGTFRGLDSAYSR